ncbi:MAG: universal stress protein [Aquificae bacterium]|nr:universal stress protein [Aquificota bacterium]
MQFKKILVAVDFNQDTDQILQTAITLAKLFNSQIKLIHIIENSLFPIDEDGEGLFDPADLINISYQIERITQEAEEKLKQLAQKVSSTEGIKTAYTVKVGDIAEEILETAESGDYDLTVVGAGKGTYHPIGTETEKVINKARNSVLVVKKDLSKGINSIVCGYDFLPNSIEALETATEIAKKTGAKLKVIHGDTEEVFAHFEDVYKAVLNRKIQLLEDIRQKLQQEGVNVEVAIEKGDPVEVILRNSEGADLITVGKRQRKDIKRFFLGSTAMKLVRNAPTSVLIVRKR